MPKKASTFDKPAFEKEYNKRLRQFTEIKDEAEHSLRKKLDIAKIKFHSIPSRIKELDSCIAKIEKNQIEKPFDQMTDLVGLRVICLFLSDIPKIEELIKKIFVVIKSDNKVDGGDNSIFGYMSVHHIVRFGSKHKGERYDSIKSIPFEIQVRTIAMDAWANISHFLDYKTEQDIPHELKRDFHALSGMFYVADKHFQLFFEQRRLKLKEITKVFEEGKQRAVFDQPVNFDTIIAYVNDRLPANVQADSSFVSSFVNDLIESKYKTIGEIENVLARYEEELSSLSTSGKFNQVGIIVVILSTADENFFKIMAKNRNLKTSREETMTIWKTFAES